MQPLSYILRRAFRGGLLALIAVQTFSVASAEVELKQTAEMAAQTRWVVNTINARHYLRDSMESLDGTEIVEAYIQDFDYLRMYFLRSEIDDFVFRFGNAMEEFLKKGNLYAAFEMYEAFRTTAKARTDWVFDRLQKDFDFTVDETFTPDRREAEWPTNTAEADALWEQRLKYELLNELMSLASEAKDEDAVADSEDSTETVKKESSSLEPKNPDIYDEDDEEKFDPTKIQRLLEEPEFFAEILDQARDKIHRRYERNLGYTLDREAAEVQESFINAMTQLFDPHSTFLSADTLESFNSSVQNSFVGIGALLEDVDGICTIKELIPGGPAEESRLLGPEDQILGVAQGEDGEFEDVVDMQLRYIVRKIKGEKNTIVRLLIHPGDASDPSVRKDIPITRDEVKLTANLASGKLISVPVDDTHTVPVGVIELPSFYGNIGAGNTLTTTSDDVTELINKLREAGAQGLILDLRMNGGGLLSEAVRVAGLFIPVGPVVQVRDKDGRTDVLSDRDMSLQWDGPLIVLTSRFSASASEIVAGALQDHDRALIVGNTSTHGKGTVQEVYHMNNRPAFSWFQTKPAAPEARPVASKITIKQFYLPDGSSTQVKGVPSDIALPSVNEFLPIGEDDLPHALVWDEVKPVEWINDWKKLNIDSPEDPALKTALREASSQRLEVLEEFKFLKQQITWRRQLYEEKAISLHLGERIAKKIREQSYIEELDETYKALTENDYAIEEFKLKIAEEQDELSRKNLLEPTVEIDEGEVEVITAEIEATEEAEEEEDEPTYDIYLRESARIMADWIQQIGGPKTAETKTTVQTVDAM
ncbi:MAG: carboxy terminal-processing peptidase [Opitutales bacterium]|jgi:carboxyl-terminal processing protease|nr:carboxy terminal-processing peptidase [Opitutales bacterium]MDP4644204.1 carboxy terminal-processing peptidase [Opitutales bacterium]MDP4776705.1 carboxy terminal-processing peptidase [Opitutales bacterium]MDP4883723.1 carboxy terminal-processing peptidase [Opitutales bacterium]MDP5079410.1 carboxy terminal-processing peptidase [Opitutales bacterium]